MPRYRRDFGQSHPVGKGDPILDYLIIKRHEAETKTHIFWKTHIPYDTGWSENAVWSLLM
jgi:hypothetical protein